MVTSDPAFHKQGSWENLGKPDRRVTEDKIIKRVFAMLKDIGNIRILWTE
jgi:hypothetical protein